MNYFDAVDFSECHSEEVISSFDTQFDINLLNFGSVLQIVPPKIGNDGSFIYNIYLYSLVLRQFHDNAVVLTIHFKIKNCM